MLGFISFTPTYELYELLKEISGRKWGQLYLAGPIMKVIEKAGT